MVDEMIVPRSTIIFEVVREELERGRLRRKFRPDRVPLNGKASVEVSKDREGDSLLLS